MLLSWTVVNEPWKAPTEADKLSNPLANDPKAMTKGRKLFDAYCWVCHGATGKGDGPSAAALKVRPAALHSALVQSQTDGAIFWKVTNGRGEMAPYVHSLSDAQRWALVSYIRSLKE